MSAQAKYILEYPAEVYLRSAIRGIYQRLQRYYCPEDAVHIMCFRYQALLYRSRLNGTWISAPDWRYDAPVEQRYGCAPRTDLPEPQLCAGTGATLYPINLDEAPSGNIDTGEAAVIKMFGERLRVAKECVVITATPIEINESGRARYLAEQLGVPFIDVDRTGLFTIDHVHLFIGSAELYSKRFLARLAPLLEHCRNEH